MHWVSLILLLGSVSAAQDLKITALEADIRLIEELPLAPSSEVILGDRLQQAYDDLPDSYKPGSLTRVRTLARGILNRQRKFPPHKSLNGLKALAYETLFHVAASDTTVRGSELLEIVQGFERHATNNPHVSYAILPALLIERSTYYSEAEAITRRGLDQAEAYVHVRRTSETEKEHARRKNWLYSRIHDALGWVLIHQDRLKEAAAELETAINLNKGNQIAWYHRGIVAERLGELDSAESFYSQSLSISWPGENPAEISLARLYEVRNADKEGYATYRRNLSTQHTSLRREDVLAARLATPFRPPAFAMMTIAADTVSLDQNLGKIQVINFWGTWCAPCVQELPELQALHEKYTGDGGVSIITINNDGDADMVKDWLADRSYSFTTLFDDGYVKERAAIRSFPTTWFVDQTGLVTYVQAGSTLRLLEEFSWRIESLR